MSAWIPQVALIGRPNVGKSTLFNRLTESKAAIVEDMPGVTRDRQYGFCTWNALRFEVVDTGGFEPKTEDAILAAMRRQSDIAIQDADFVIFLTDGREGILPQDHEIFQKLRRLEKPFVVAVNKLDNVNMELMAADFYALGIDEVFAISASHGTGVGDILDVVVSRLKELGANQDITADQERLVVEESHPSTHPHVHLEANEEFEDEDDEEFDGDFEDDESDEESEGLLLEEYGDDEELAEDEPIEIDFDESSFVPRIAVLGKPNVGKSTLINHILGEERLLALPIPGTTRDAIDVELTYQDKPYLFIDTAGIRKKKYVADRLEREMIHRSVDALGRSDIALFLIDASEGVSEQDAKIAGLAHNRGRAVIVIVNKWDLMKHHASATREFEAELRHQLKFLHYAPVLFCSALTGLRVHKIFQTIDNVYQNYRKRVSTGELNRFFAEMLRYHPPPVHRGKPIKFYYITQARIAPPTFFISANYPDAAHITYQRFIINSLRAEFGFEGVPIRLKFRKR